MRSILVELKHGFSIGDQTYKTLTLRQPRVADLIQAEQDISSKGGDIAFRAALIAICIERVADWDGVVTTKMISDLALTDYSILLEAFTGLDEEETQETKKDETC
ncbi:hypothetical protein BGI05_05165 [Snodgrassella alvi]|uniref:phage tail assembly protein n=1 Tax=Snodgrassella alvi TaxID=1196083 RepID=UPI000A03A7D0|nr:phage tail assembly protein [Snodgrassella alvi]ORF03605.1 hypothetical protein BGH97_02565 [Snodgrassella alvi]ORF09381.1 hypothetical protein BGH99_02540 [Snodgrassella alvi]ORF14702.1 hypothetical protein BGI00_01805 [Snodgrassella alvi]ORF15904.1 hypothetical protein BGI02_01985 [Snodgrassella alvi]ORF20999.1 hypothetical protein BGI05_05165 [Snodgrassella alvi]